MNALQTATAAGDLDRPALSADQVRLLLHRELSPRVRLFHGMLLFLSLTVGLAVASLWLTEPNPLPLRTHLAFGAVTLIALAWACLASYVLTRRKPLFAHHRVIAGSIAVAASTLFLVGSTTIALMRGNIPAALTASLTGIVFVALAALMLHRARAMHRRLINLREELLAQVISQPR